MHSEKKTKTHLHSETRPRALVPLDSMPAPLTFLTQDWLLPGGGREMARFLVRTGAHLSPGTTLSFLVATTVVT